MTATRALALLVVGFAISCTQGESGGVAGSSGGPGGSAGSSGSGGSAGSSGSGGSAGTAGNGGFGGFTCSGGSAGVGGVAGATACPTGFDLHGDLTLDNYPRVDGSTSTLPLARVIACELLGVPYAWKANMGSEGEAEIVPVAQTPDQEPLAAGIMDKIVHSKTHQAYLNLIDRQADLIMVANPPSPDEARYACNAGVTFDARTIALDALVIVDNVENSVTALTTQQIRDIFLGKITRWSEVGGSDDPIDPYVRPENSGSQQLMESIVMGGKPLSGWPPDRAVPIAGMGGLIDKIKTDPFAIGYSVYYWVTYQYPSNGYRSLAVDGTAPTAPTIASRKYPFTAPVWIVTRGELDPGCLAYQLRDWLLTSGGQVVVGKSGYVPAAGQ